MIAKVSDIQRQTADAADTGMRGMLDEDREQGGGLDLREYWRIAWKYKFGIMGVTLLVGLIAALMVMNKIHIYRATATLLIEREPVKYVSIEEVYGLSGYNWEYYQTQYELLRSRPIAERVVNKLELDQRPRQPVKRDEGLFGWKNLFPEEWFPAPRELTPEEIRENTIRSVQGSILVNPIQNSQLVNISVEGPEPELIARIANATADAYVEENLEGRLQMTQKATSWLTERLVELRGQLAASEARLQQYRDQEQLIDVEGVDSLPAQEVSLLTSRLTDARKARLDAEALYNQVREVQADPNRGLESIPAILRHPLVTQFRQAEVTAERRVSELSDRYGPKHPNMVAAESELQSARTTLARQMALAADGVESEYRTAVANERSLERDLGGAKSSLQDVNRKEYALQSLEREVEANRQLYELFQTRVKETSAAGGVETANARLVEPALVPSTPVRPNKQRTVMVALFLGLVAALGLAFLLEHLDNTFKSSEDVERRLHVPVLGVLPRLKVKSGKDLSPLRHFEEHSKTTFSEAVRTVRTGVMLSALDNPHKILLITSSVPGEGKTTLAMNLSYALGHLKKVLLIDADMRRPMVARASGKRTSDPGLSQFLTGDAKLSECLREVKGSNLHVMQSGVIPPNPLEILSSKRFEDAVVRLSETFDHIVIDCAPALAVSDALILSKVASGVIYLVKADSTPYQAAQSGIRRLRRANAPLIGVVINSVSARTPKYGKYGKYGYYGEYYTEYGYTSRQR